jgi:hypothetical protein
MTSLNKTPFGAADEDGRIFLAPRCDRPRKVDVPPSIVRSLAAILIAQGCFLSEAERHSGLCKTVTSRGCDMLGIADTINRTHGLELIVSELELANNYPRGLRPAIAERQAVERFSI